MSLPLDRPTTTRRIVIAVCALLSLTLVGAIGYRMIEQLSPIDSVYMAVITLSTVGYGEVKPLSPAGRLFSVAYIMVGLGIALYTVGAVAEFFLEDRFSGLIQQRKMKKRIDSLSGHVIIVGFGRFGSVVAGALKKDHIPMVVLDEDETARDSLGRLGVPYLIGSALHEETLLEAGIERARAIMIGTSSDSDNVFIALSARALNPNITIHGRAETETGERRLRNAGAQLVVSPHQVGGQRIANALVRPAVVDFFELSRPGVGGEIDLEEVQVLEGCELEGCEVGSLGEPGSLIVVGHKQGEHMELQPSPETVLARGDRLVVVGKRDRLNKLAQRARGSDVETV